MATDSIEIADADVVEEESRALAVVPTVPTATLTVTPSVEAAELVKRLEVIKSAMDQAMTKDVDYGVIPGTGTKPTLYKPGAEKLAVLFQFDVQTVIEKRWGPGAHLTATAMSTVFHIPTGARVGSGEGLCSTFEKKYGKRTGKRSCPNCGAEQINRSKFPPRDKPGAEPGWYCHSKFGGCGAQFDDAADPKIIGQVVGEIENPDLADMWNTVVKMAHKRALVAAILLTTGASALFTQDVEDLPREETAPEPARQEPQRQLLDDASVQEVLASIGKAQVTTEELRTKLVTEGVAHVPEGSVTQGTIQSMTGEQAIAIVAWLESLPRRTATK